MRGLRGRARPTRFVATSIAALVLGAAAVLLPGPSTSAVLADCATIKDVPAAQRSGDAVFVGDVYRTENDGRWAVVLVDERWQGAAGLPDTVQVHGGPGPGTTTTTDRMFTEGRWLFDVTNAGPFYRGQLLLGVAAVDGRPLAVPARRRRPDAGLGGVVAARRAGVERCRPGCRARRCPADRDPRLHPDPATPATAARVDALTEARQLPARAISRRSASSVG